MTSPLDFICEALRGEDPAFTGSPDEVLSTARTHGVVSLLHSCERRGNWPQKLSEQLRQEAIAQAMWELRHQLVLATAIEALAGAGDAPVLLKGSALAYTLYPEPSLRFRGDTDILIAPGSMDAAFQALRSLGLQQHIAVSGRHVTYQASFTCSVADGTAHTIDLHWRANNSALLASLFTHSELVASAQAVNAISPLAIAPSLPISLLFACVHLATHETNPYFVDGTAITNTARLIWLMDISLLAKRMSAEEWAETGRMARDKQLAGLARNALVATEKHLGPLPSWRSLLQPAERERPALFVDAGPFGRTWMDLRVLTIGDRITWLRETLLPPAEYMRQRYDLAGTRWLPGLYARRAAGGLAKQVIRRSRP